MVDLHSIPNDERRSMWRLLEVLEMQSLAPEVLIEGRARNLCRESATHVLYDVAEADRTVVSTVGTFLIARERITTPNPASWLSLLGG